MDNKDSVYELITKLCEKYSSLNPSGARVRDVKNSRSKCYEILLKKRQSKESVVNDLENITDPVCHLLAWQFQLLHKHNSPRDARKLQSCSEELQKLDAFNNKTFSNVVHLLLHLRRLPGREDTIMQTSVDKRGFTEGLSKSLSTLFDDSLFHLPSDLSNMQSKFRDHQFRLSHSRTSITEFNFSERFLGDTLSSEVLQPIVDESCVSLKQSIWEFASQVPPSKCRTWEEFGNASSSKEIPFLCESDMKSNEWLQNLPSAFQLANNVRKVVGYQDFVKDIQLLLVGVESKSFKYDDRGELALVTGVCIEGLSNGATVTYCKDHLFCGSCYKGLERLCTPNPITLGYLNNGYIFKELCETIKRYLSYYRVVVFSVSHTTPLLALHERMKRLREYTKVLASVCKVGPFRESGEIPHGVHLLNYLYQKVLAQTNKNNLTVLYSILYPCCQVYFSFLRQWISEGSVNDPYSEFFISINPKYINSRGRTYWSRSYRVREDIIPDFITGLSEDLLFCGKAMRLLKLCVPNSPLCSYVACRQSGIICCCIMSEQLAIVELNNHYYYLEATSMSGPRISLAHIISRLREQDEVFLNLVSKKRAATLHRIVLERKKIADTKHKNRREEMRILKEQYMEAQIQKHIKMTIDLEQEMEVLEKNIRIQSLHDKIIEEEAVKLIEFYNSLYETSDQRRAFYERQIEELKNADISSTSSQIKHVEQPLIKVTSKESQDLTEKDTSSDIVSCEDCITSRSDDFTSAHSLDVIQEDLDVQNANTEEIKENNANIINAVETFEAAKRNKAQILALEMGYAVDTSEAREVRDEDLKNANNPVTEAERNKLKVMSSEFGYAPNEFTCKKSSKIVEFNRNKMLGSNQCFYHDEVNIDNRTKVLVTDNANNNLNIEENSSADTLVTKWANKKQDSLSLDLSKIKGSKVIHKSPKFELDKVSPMSIDSSTLSDIMMTPLERLNTNFDDITESSAIITASTSTATVIKTGFNFEMDKPKSVFNLDNQIDLTEKIPIMRHVPVRDSEAVSSNCLKLCLQQSISIPLITQIKLVTNELLKHFIVDLKYLQHLECLKNFFFLMDGEFGRNITEGLFEKLYDSNFPTELINCHTLQALVFKALDYSSRCKERSSYLSFRINSLPGVFDLGDPDVFDCLSLTYKTPWPLNILLPSDAIAKYDEVFKFLLKLHRVSWVLKNVFQNLKSLVKETESQKTVFLLKSPQYRRLHQCRHIMTNFIQTLQNYVIGEVLQTNWEILEKNLESVINFDQLYTAHIAYIKNILFMCLLNQKSVPIRKVLHKIFIVILKFYDYFRSRSWREINNVYIHPNFKRLQDIFNNFEELVIYLFKIGYKVVKSGYQPHLLQLLNMLDVNNYYNEKIIKESR